jgi:hypothetical protein
LAIEPLRAHDVRVVARQLGALVGALDPVAVGVAHAQQVWDAFDRIERLAANAKTLLADMVATSGSWKDSGARSPAEHLARRSGTTVRAARDALDTSRALAALPDVTHAMRTGALSSEQAVLVAPAAVADPAVEKRLIALAATTSMRSLRDECCRVRAAADDDPVARHERIHRTRSVRTFTEPDGTWSLIARGTPERGAVFEKMLAQLVDERFARARTDGIREERDAYAFDALMTMAERAVAPAPESMRTARTRVKYLAVLRADVESLRRGWIENDEVCEIAGVGPVPVAVARRVLGDSVLKLVLTRGVDVATVVHLGRGPNAAQRVALLWSQPMCSNVACSRPVAEVDHRRPWRKNQQTALPNLDGLCHHDHDLKTRFGWSLVDGVGRRAFVPRTDPRHPEHRERPPP